jgi:hypothetical protein
MINIVANVAVAVVKEAAVVAMVAGTTNAAVKFISRKMGGATADLRVELNNVATDFVEGNVNLVKDFPLSTAGMLIGAGVAAVNPVAGALVAVGTLGVMTYEFIKSYRRIMRAFDTEAENIVAEAQRRADSAPKPQPKPKPKRMKFDAEIDAEKLQSYTGAEARAYGYSWFEENVATKKERPRFEDLKSQLMTALMKIQIPSNKRIMFVRGVEDAWAHTA